MAVYAGFKLPESQKTWYEGSCHCHAVEFKALLPSLTENVPGEGEPMKVNNCNCSICVKSGYLLIYPPRKDVVFTKGWDTMSEYKFATKRRTHKFCGICGTSVLIDFHGEPGTDEDDLGLSARLLKGIDLDKLNHEKSDGRMEENPEFNDRF